MSIRHNRRSTNSCSCWRASTQHLRSRDEDSLSILARCRYPQHPGIRKRFPEPKSFAGTKLPFTQTILQGASAVVQQRPPQRKESWTDRKRRQDRLLRSTDEKRSTVRSRPHLRYLREVESDDARVACSTALTRSHACLKKHAPVPAQISRRGRFFVLRAHRNQRSNLVLKVLNLLIALQNLNGYNWHNENDNENDNGASQPASLFAWRGRQEL